MLFQFFRVYLKYDHVLEVVPPCAVPGPLDAILITALPLLVILVTVFHLMSVSGEDAVPVFVAL